MTNKPVKKSDLGKLWMKERSNNPKKYTLGYYLIVIGKDGYKKAVIDDRIKENPPYVSVMCQFL